MAGHEISAHRVVIVGGGFGGLQAALGLRRAAVEITLIDRRNFHLFQPLSYQVATGSLSPGEVAYPLRAIFKRDRNVRVLLAEVERFELERREVVLRSVAGLPAPERVAYDTLIVAGGSHYSYFGHDEWSVHAAEVKSLESALTVRSRILSAFEAAELERDPARRERVADVRGGRRRADRRRDGRPDRRARARHAAQRLPLADPGSARVLLVEAADRVLHRVPAVAEAFDSLRSAVGHGIRGGALYDALVAATAAHHRHMLVSADRRAAPVYHALGVNVTYIGEP